MTRFTRQATRLALLILLIFVGSFARAADTQYVEEVEKWRQEFDADIRTGGWLVTIGRVKIGEGTWTLGASPSRASFFRRHRHCVSEPSFAAESCLNFSQRTESKYPSTIAP